MAEGTTSGTLSRGDPRGPRVEEKHAQGDPCLKVLTTFTAGLGPELLPCPMGLSWTHLGKRPVPSGLVPPQPAAGLGWGWGWGGSQVREGPDHRNSPKFPGEEAPRV